MNEIARGHVGSPIVFEGYLDRYDLPICAVQFSMDEGNTWMTSGGFMAEPNRRVYCHFTYTPEERGTHRLIMRNLSPDGTVGQTTASVFFLVD